MTNIKTDFNISPYFDDYDESKSYHRVLFRPSTAVQARELTQLQTISQEQIKKFGDSIYKDGSIVDGVAITYYSNTHYISLTDKFNSNANLVADEIDNTYLITNSQDSNTAVRAKVLIAKNGSLLSQPETNRFYLTYISTGKDGANNDVELFSPGDTLYVYTANQNVLSALNSNNLFDSIETLASNSSFTSNGYSYCIGVTDGVIFQKGFFQRVDPQVITVTDFTTDVSGYVVGFDTQEEIVTEFKDTTLLDNALGYENENAPGAHRLKLTPVLVSKTRAEISNTNVNFTSIVEFDNNEPTQQNDNPQYSIIETEISKRTYEESGDYVVKPFRVEAVSNTANANFIDYVVSPGIAYVRGHRIEKIGSSIASVERAIETDFRQNEIITGNYGNYVICDEFLGAFDTETLQEVSIYDQPQNAISETEGVTSAPSGNLVGKANVRAVVFRNGEKGNASAQYLFYVFNVVMNSGKSFKNDAKSFYSDGNFGKAKADLVLENNSAVLKDSSNSKFIFQTGIQAVKALAGNTGINDTIYSFNQIKSGAMNSSGVINITIDSAAPGASTERVYSAVENDYQVYVSANTFTANLSGTITIGSSNVAVSGTSTTFTTDFRAGDNIRIQANSSVVDLRQVVSVTNNTFMTINSPVTVSNTSAAYNKYFVTGSPLPVDTVSLGSNSTFTVDTGLTIASATPQTVYVSYPVIRNQAEAIDKVVLKNRYVKINCSNNAAGTSGPWDLGVVDVHKIRNIYLGSSYSTSNPNRNSWFLFDNGQKDNYYDHGKIAIKPEYAANITSSTRILVEMDLFEANTSTSVGFFSVESYPIDDVSTANTNAIKTIEIPYHNGVSLRDVVDFRPRKYNTANTAATTIGAASENPAASNTSFDVPAGGQYHIYPDTNFIADYEYYLPRYDLLSLDVTGRYNVTLGISSETPRIPNMESDQLLVSQSYIPPYPSATKREALAYNNPNIPYVTTTLKSNKRYTMQDIGKIAKRIENLEYYTVLNSLEQEAKNKTITDENGLDRFKNGIFADTFSTNRNGNVSDIEYRIAVDSKNSLIRPYFQKHDVDFEFYSANSSNVRRTGQIVSLDYISENYITQKYATKFRNTTQDSWRWAGNLGLYPSFDYYRDEQIAPPTTINLDLTEPWDKFSNSPFGSHWGEWETLSTSSSSSVAPPRATSGGSIVTTTTTTSTELQRLGENLIVSPQYENYDTGAYITDFTISPYMRSRLVAFISYNMKPNTKIYPFFDNINVAAHCAPGELSGLIGFEEGKEDRVVNRTGEYGDQLVSDSTGFVCGVFRIPVNTFRIGEREFKLANITDLSLGEPTTVSKSTYVAENISVTKGSTTLSVIQPDIYVDNISDSRIVTDVNISENFIPATREYQERDDKGGGSLEVYRDKESGVTTVVSYNDNGSIGNVYQQYEGENVEVDPVNYETIEENAKENNSSKVVCTAMNEYYGFGSFRQSIWLAQSRGLPEEYQIGYHAIFLPLIDYAYKTKKPGHMLVRKTIEHITRRRTADIWKQKRGKRDYIGAVERSIIEPICYITGWVIKRLKKD